MILPAVIFHSEQKQVSGKLLSKKVKRDLRQPLIGLNIIYPLLGLCVTLSFLLLSLEIVETKPRLLSDNKQVLGFKELLFTPKPFPVSKGIYPPPELLAKSVIVMDSDSAAVLYQKDADLRLFPASTTKMMTALVALDNYPLDKTLSVSSSKVEGNTIQLIPGETLTVESLLYGLLIESGNDVAEVLAENIPGGVETFVALMNQKAVSLKLENTHFTNPIGLDSENHYSTSRDLARLAMELIKNRALSKIVSVPEITIKDTTGMIIHKLKNTNELVGKVEGVTGIKTGFTPNAGECLVSLVEKQGRKVVIVILGSTSRFEDTNTLINWVFEDFEWKIISPENRT